MKSKNMKRRIFPVFLLMAWLIPVSAATALPVPVMLSFDTERGDDAESLGRLGITVPATYFITGQFAETHRDFVDSLAGKGNTIGSHAYGHPHLTELDPRALEEELKKAKTTLEAITGKPVIWFRAPFMEYNGQVMRVLKKMGFLYDSSDQERWQRQDILFELPVSSFRNGTMIASDYDMLYKNNATAADLEYLLKELYREKSLLGQPAVILLHPKMVSRYPEVIKNFIAYVREAGGVFISADTYLALTRAQKPHRYAVWIDFSLGSHNPEEIAADLSGIGATDVFLMARDAEGHAYYRPDAGEDLFGKTLELLKLQGIRVHAWLPALADADAARQHPEWAMASQNGTPSDAWLSPVRPEVVERTSRIVVELLKKYRLDGIHLDDLEYPDLNYDFSSGMTGGFKHQNGLASSLSNTELISSHYTEWTNWRAERIAEFAGRIRNVVRAEERDRTEFSAALSGRAATYYRHAEIHGQDIALISRHLDLLVSEASYGNGSPVSDGSIGNLVLSMRSRAGKKPLIVGFAAPDEESRTTKEFTRALAAASSGIDGIGITPYLFVFQRGSKGMNMPAESMDILKKVFSGQTLSSVEKPFLTGMISFPGVSLVPAVMLLLALVIMGLVAVPVFIKKNNALGPEEHVNAASPGKTWREIDAGISAGCLDGGTAEQLVELLSHYDARKVQQNRIAMVLDTIDRSNDPLPELYRFMEHSEEWKALALKYFYEVCLLGYAAIDDHSVTITPSGKGVLLEARGDGFEKDFWVFVEKCLHETVAVDCPYCGTENLTNFYWNSYECAECGKIARLGQSAYLAVRKTGEHTAYTNSIEFY